VALIHDFHEVSACVLVEDGPLCPDPSDEDCVCEYTGVVVAGVGNECCEGVAKVEKGGFGEESVDFVDGVGDGCYLGFVFFNGVGFGDGLDLDEGVSKFAGLLVRERVADNVTWFAFAFGSEDGEGPVDDANVFVAERSPLLHLLEQVLEFHQVGLIHMSTLNIIRLGIPI
jgi:hypothetical protein